MFKALKSRTRHVRARSSTGGVASNWIANARASVSMPPIEHRDNTLRRKVCLVGPPRVGKTSLLRRAVDGVFNENYHSTIGVRIDKAIVQTQTRTVTCVTWDLRGDEIDCPVEFRYLDGMAAYLLVVDGCRPDTFASAQVSVDRIESAFGPVPFVLLINKADRLSSWMPPPQLRESLKARSIGVIETSARTGQGVDDAFQLLAERFVAGAAQDDDASPVRGTAFGQWA